MKLCFKCHRRLPVTEFYRHAQMADGHLGKCKACTKKDVTEYRAGHLEEVRAYDRGRANQPQRIELRKRVSKAWRKADRRRDRSHNAARRTYTQLPPICQLCGTTAKRLERHHPSYDLPKLIAWLCKPCHVLADKQRRLVERTAAS